jgi:hypothetical protein
MADPDLSKEKYIYVSAEVAGCRISIARKNLEYDAEELDVYLFEPDYTIAGSTGFLLWPGTWVLLDLLRGEARALAPHAECWGIPPHAAAVTQMYDMSPSCGPLG